MLWYVDFFPPFNLNWERSYIYDSEEVYERFIGATKNTMNTEEYCLF
jgi:hypothetical protein